MMDPREKKRLFEEILAKNDCWLSGIARHNAPLDSCEDLEQEIRIDFWKSLDSYDGEISHLEKRFFAVAINRAKAFRRSNYRMQKREKAVYPNPVFVEQDRDLLRFIEEFAGRLGELDRQIFKMRLDALSIAEVNLRKRMSRIKEQLIKYL